MELNGQSIVALIILTVAFFSAVFYARAYKVGTGTTSLVLFIMLALMLGEIGWIILGFMGDGTNDTATITVVISILEFLRFAKDFLLDVLLISILWMIHKHERTT